MKFAYILIHFKIYEPIMKWIFFLNIKMTYYYRQLFLFYIPNLKVILTGKIKVNYTVPRVQQTTLITGQGNVRIGKNCNFGYKLGGFHRGGSIELQAREVHSIIVLGNNISTNNNIFICASNYIEIGDNTLIGQSVTIMDFEAHGIKPSERRNNVNIGKVIIGDNVWIGNNVLILKNTVIGSNSVVAAGAVVSGVFPNDVIIGGVPAKTIKSING